MLELFNVLYNMVRCGAVGKCNVLHSKFFRVISAMNYYKFLKISNEQEKQMTHKFNHIPKN